MDSPRKVLFVYARVYWVFYRWLLHVWATKLILNGPKKLQEELGIKLIGLAFKRVILLKRLKLRLSQCTGVTNWINTKAPTANIRLEDILARTSTKDYPAAEAVYHHMEMIFESKGKILNLIPGRNRKPLLIVWDWYSIKLSYQTRVAILHSWEKLNRTFGAWNQTQPA